MDWIALLLTVIVAVLGLTIAGLLAMITQHRAARESQLKYTLRLLSQILDLHRTNSQNVKEIERLNNKLTFKRNERN